MKIPAKLIPMFVILLLAIAFLLGRYQGQLELLKGGSEKAEEAQKQETGQETQPTARRLENGETLDSETWALLLKEGYASEKGEKKAPVTIVEYTDYLCPFCAEYVGSDSIPSRDIDTMQIYQKIQQQYVNTGKVKYILRDFTNVHGEAAVLLAQVARCAGDQGKYWEMHDSLFENQSQIGTGDIKALTAGYAQSLGLNTTQFASCVNEGKYANAVQSDTNLGVNAGVGGTPSFLINGTMLIGAQPFEEFQKVIDAALK